MILPAAMLEVARKIEHRRAAFPPRKAIGEHDHEFRDRFRREQAAIHALESQLADLILVACEAAKVGDVRSDGPDEMGLWHFTDLHTESGISLRAKPLPTAAQIAAQRDVLHATWAREAARGTHLAFEHGSATIADDPGAQAVS